MAESARGPVPPEEPSPPADEVGAGTSSSFDGKALVNAPWSKSEKGLADGRGLVNGNGLGNGKGLRSATGLVNGHGLVNGKGLVNGDGFVNGKGLVNGHGHPKGALINGRGFTNEKGLVNGNGLVNGRGEIDAPVRTSGKRNARTRSRTRLIAIVAVAAALLLLLSVFTISRIPSSGRLVVDGNFSDWNGRAFYSDERSPNLPAGLDLVAYSVAAQDTQMFFCVRSAGNMLSGKTAEKGVDTVNILIDSDGNPATGYRVGGLGADRRIEVYGWDGLVRGSGVYSFSKGRSQQDWNGWAASGSVQAAVSGRSLEVSAGSSNLGLSKGSEYRVLFRVQDSNGLGDTGRALVGPSPGSLVVTQESVVSPVLPAGSKGAPVLSLGLYAQVRDVQVRGLTLTRNGDAGPSDVGDIALKVHQAQIASGSFAVGSDRITLDFDLNVSKGENATVDVCVDIPSNATPGASFGLRVAGEEDIAAGTGATSLIGLAPSSCYLVSSPAHIKIDGAFADWDRTTLRNDTTGDGAGVNTDLTAYQGVKSNGTVSFYASVDGTMMGGVLFPGTKERPTQSPAGPSHSPGPVVSLPVLTGCDTVEVFIDSDHDYLTGANVGPALFGADYALVVSGIGGEILSKEVLVWDRSLGWEHKGSLNAACDETRLELAAPMTLLGLNDSSSFGAYIVASDWRGKQDMSEQRMDFVDPLELSSDAAIYSSDDGSNWNDHDLSMINPVDFCTDPTGYYYTLTKDGDVWESTGTFTQWSEIIETDSVNTFVAIATDSNSGDDNTPYLYALDTSGQTYYSSVGDTSWSKGGTVGNTADYIDLCYASGIGTDATLYAISQDTGNKAYCSSTGGKTWDAFGDKTVGKDTNAIDNVGITYASGIWSDDYLFVFQDDGNIQYHSISSPDDDWATLDTGTTSIPSSSFVDIDWDSGSSTNYVVDDSGKTYTVLPSSDTTGEGDWSSLIGTSANHAIAISGDTQMEVTTDCSIYKIRSGEDSAEFDMGPFNPIDICTDHTTGCAYILTKDGDVWKSTGDWDTWSELIDTASKSGFVAIDTDSDSSSPYLYSMTSDGEIYYAQVSDSDWTDAGNINAGSGIDLADLCYGSGSDTSATLYAVAEDTGYNVYECSGDVTSWSTFGTSTVGNDNNGEKNVGILYVSGVWSDYYLFVLQNDGDIRYDTISDTNGSWARLAGPAGGTYTDLDWDVINSEIWVVDNYGNTYTYKPTSNVGENDWSDLIGTSGSNTVAIAVNEIPEYNDIAIPFIGIIAVFIVIRRLRFPNTE